MTHPSSSLSQEYSCLLRPSHLYCPFDGQHVSIQWSLSEITELSGLSSMDIRVIDRQLGMILAIDHSHVDTLHEGKSPRHSLSILVFEPRIGKSKQTCRDLLLGPRESLQLC